MSGKKDKDVIGIRQIILGLAKVAPRLIHIFLNITRALKIKNDDTLSLGLILEINAIKYRDEKAVLFEDFTLTHSEFNSRINQYANYFLNVGIAKHEVVVVFIENGPETLFMVGALSKIGAVASLINPNQKENVLAHSIGLDHKRHIIVSESLYENLKLVIPRLGVDFLIHWQRNSSKQNCPKNCIDLNKLIGIQKDQNPPTTRSVWTKDRFANIFTSGTTGLPKAAIQTHRRWLQLYYWFGKVNLNLSKSDTLYVPIPFFHSNALMVAWASAAANGAALAIRRKFSVTAFWSDIHKFRATSFIYIGEICRYLNNMPEIIGEEKNTITKIIGNGLRPEIWVPFKKRFGIDTIMEFYGSADGNIAFTNTFNFDRTVGWTPAKYSLIHFNLKEELPEYGEDGFCRKCGLGEKGLLISKINKKTPLSGYVNKQENDKKILRNVFKDGDAWFNSGDIMKNIGYRHLTFIDRIGDTFRWKGENVATTEVEKVVNAFPGVIISAVYGVRIPLTDGKAGMLALQAAHNWNEKELNSLNAYLREELPSYAIPIFLRFCDSFEFTSTQKVKKTRLKEEAFNINIFTDKIYCLLPNKGNYVELNKEVYLMLNMGKYSF